MSRKQNPYSIPSVKPNYHTPKVVSLKWDELRKNGYNNASEWLADPNHLYIGRQNSFIPQSKWHNPFTINQYNSRSQVINKFENYLLSNNTLMNSLNELENYTEIGCWCKPQSCHGDIILNEFRKYKIRQKHAKNIARNTKQQIHTQNQKHATNNNNNSCDVRNIPMNPSQNNQDSKMNEYKANDNHALCKFYGAGYCYYGGKCRSLHNADAINIYEQQWLDGKIIINKQQLPLVAIDNTFSKQRICKQKFDYILVLDLEGKDEIIELPCILIDLNCMMEISRFHCWIRPTKWDKGEIPKYKQNDINYVNMKCKAIGFENALKLLSEWLCKFGINLNDSGEYIKNKNNELSKTFLCAICGNWDIKTQIPKQCKICNIDLPKYFNQWMNVKDFALNIYSHFQPYHVKGMFLLLKNLKMKLYGTHHLGMDDTYNIARIVIKYAMNNAVFDCTAYRDAYTGQVVYKNNNRRVSRYHTSKRPKNNYFQYRR